MWRARQGRGGCQGVHPLSRGASDNRKQLQQAPGLRAVSVTLLLPRQQPPQNKLFFEKLWGQRAHTCSPGRFGQVSRGVPRPSSPPHPLSCMMQCNTKQELRGGEQVLSLHKDLTLEFLMTSLKIGPKLQVPNSKLSGDAEWCGFSEGAQNQNAGFFILILPGKSCVTLDKSLPLGGLQSPL